MKTFRYLDPLLRFPFHTTSHGGWGWLFAGVLCGVGTATFSQAALISLDIYARQTDPTIAAEAQFHVININPDVRLRNKLFLFLPGTGGRPDNCRLITATAANLGFHAIALRYPATGKVAETCADTLDSNCHGRVRQEIIEGVDASDLVEVNRSESLENRLIQLLRYLHRRRPQDNWGQFFDAQTNILWDRIRIGGLSQGASHAHWIAMKHPVDRCLIFANQDWWAMGGRLSDWQLQPNATAPERYFGFIHSQDVGFRSGHQQVLWATLGLPRFGPVVFVEETAPGYLGSHTLTSAVMPQLGNDGEPNYHGSVAVDGSTPLTPDGQRSIFQPVWEYLMTGPLVIPKLGVEFDPIGRAIRVSWPTVVGMNYRLESSADLFAWRTEQNLPGTGQGHTFTGWLEESGRFFRVIAGDAFDVP